MRYARPLSAIVGSALLLLSACGGGSGGGSDDSAGNDSAPAATKTVEVQMTEQAFKVAAMPTVAKGDTVIFRFTNAGKQAHEGFIGDAAAQLEYAQEAADLAGHDANPHEDAEPHDDAHPEGGVHVEPGKTDELRYTFTESGEYELACHEPGHYEAGMRMTIQVV